jgi:anti-sigma regulatory factor (Ser/Thr protein kinase)
MSSDHPGLAIELVHREPDVSVLRMSGELSLCSAGLVKGAVSKALLDTGRVLVDVSALRLTWSPAVQVFPSALAGVGGWPRARLVLFGSDASLSETLHARRVSATVPLAPDYAAGRRLLRQRPPVVARHLDLEQQLSSARRARLFVASACQDWQLDSIRDDALLVASELVENAVLHAGTTCRLSLRLDERGLRVAVRDYRLGQLNLLRPKPGHGLFLVSSVTREWHISPTDDGKSVLALLPVAG